MRVFLNELVTGGEAEVLPCPSGSGRSLGQQEIPYSPVENALTCNDNAQKNALGVDEIMRDVSAHVTPTLTSKTAPFPWHWPIIKHHSTLMLAFVKTSRINIPFNEAPGKQ